MNWDELLAEAAQKHGVSEDLPVLKRMLQAESGGDPQATSPKGGMGLMQLMPGTAKELGVKNPYDPRENVFGGVSYYRQMKDQFGGDVALALAAYNAGPGNVKKHGGLPPFKETQDYVAKVLRGAKQVAGHAWGLVSPKEAQAVEYEDEDKLESDYLMSRELAEDQEFRRLLVRFSVPISSHSGQEGAQKGHSEQSGDSQVDVARQAIPSWAGGSALDWIDKLLPKKEEGTRPTESYPGAIPTTGASPKIDYASRTMTFKEWKQFDPEGYRNYQENLKSMGVPEYDEEALREPWIDPVNVLAGFGGGMAAGGIKAALGALLGNVAGEMTGGIAGEYLTEQQKPQWAWVAALAVDVATGMAVDKAMGKAVQRLRRVRPDLSDEQALGVVKAAADHPEVREVSDLIKASASSGDTAWPNISNSAMMPPEIHPSGVQRSDIAPPSFVSMTRKSSPLKTLNSSDIGDVPPNGIISPANEKINLIQPGKSISENFELARQELPNLKNALQDISDQNQGKGIDLRIKEEERVKNKIEEYQKKGVEPASAERITDYLGSRIIFDDPVAKASEVVKGLESKGYEIVDSRNYFERSGRFGYRGYHLIVKSPDGFLAEVQIHSPQTVELIKESYVIYDKYRRYGEDIPAGLWVKYKADRKMIEEKWAKTGKVNPDDETIMGADFGLGQFFKKYFKEESGEGVKAQEPTVKYRTGPDRRALPEGGVVVFNKKPAALDNDPAGGAQTSGIISGQEGKAGIEIYPAEKTQRFTDEPFQTELKDGKYAVNINLQRIESPDEITDAIRKMAELEGVEMDAARRGTMSHEDTERLADVVGMTPKKLLARRQGQAFNAEEALAARRLLVSAAGQVRELAARAASTQGSEADLLEFRRSLSVMAGIQQQVSGMTAEAGRALSAFRIMAKETEMANRMIRDWMDGGGGPDMAKKMAEKISVLETPEQIAKVVAKTWKANTWDVFLEAWINGLLSGPLTHMRNVLGNIGAAFIQIPERWIAGQIGRFTGGGTATGEAAELTWGLVNGFREGMLLAGKALRSGEPSDLLQKIEMLPRKAISADALEMSGVLGRAVDMLGVIVRMPGRFLLAEDELFKAVGYRMELHAQAYRMAAREGLKGEKLADRMAEILADPPAHIKLAGIDAARYQTFTDEAGPIGKYFMKMAGEVHYLRLILPFIRTPSNIFRFTLQRTPLAPLLRSVREDIMAGGAKRDIALARLSLGSMIMATCAVLARAGYITGGGPQKKELRENMLREGWQPYSIRLGDTYYQVGGLEPIGTIMGMAADFDEIIRNAPDSQADELGLAAAAAAGKVFTNKTYLQGLASALEAITDPDRYGRNFIQKFAGSLVPFTSLSGTITRGIDPTIKETRAGREEWLPALQTMINEMKSRTPGLSSTLPPRRNLWGEPIEAKSSLGPDWLSPVYSTERKHSPIDMEMIKNDVAVKPPDRQIMGVDLSAQEYDRYVALAGNELKLAGKGCKDYLNKMVQTAEYKRQSLGEGGGRAYMIKNAIQAYRKAAAAKIIEEFPELKELIVENKEDKVQKLAPLQ